MEHILDHAIKYKILSKLTLSKCINNNVLRTTGRLIEMKGQLYVALETFHADGKATQENIAAMDAPKYIASLIPETYKQLNIITTSGNCEVKVSRKNKITIINQIKQGSSQPVNLEHNRKKQYILSDKQPIDFLVELGVQDKNGLLFDKKRSKFRQINRFLELVADVESSIIIGDDLYIVDLCCGKSYLSFAIYYYFAILRGLNVTMDCVDLKADVIDFCTSVAKKLGYKGLHFIAGDIRDFPVKRQPDLTVSLHACDIATDIVLAKGIDSGSRVILSTPCCHHEMMHQLRPSGHFTDFLLDHSILKQKFTDAATDALRCKALEINGYDVTALELIDPDETPKNVLIRAIKQNNTNKNRIEKLKEEYNTICNILGIHPFLWDEYVK
ncbi:MAG: SAM-dependent methyltransferase [Oscillospiraceae bacterium]|nr:SAM-dependent methyltransferase [Oscillospiraceae bacterium]